MQPGPAYLELPLDVLEVNRVEEEDIMYPVNYMMNRRTGVEPKVAEEVADILINAKNLQCL